MTMNGHGHYYSPDTHTLYDDNGKAITYFSDASEFITGEYDEVNTTKNE